jgi:hypothetical protein
MFGKNNPNYRHGRYCTTHHCMKCGTKIDRLDRSIHCNKCRPRSGKDNSFYNKKHTEKSLRLIGEKSKAKFTPEFLQRIKEKHQGTKHRDINGYTLIKDYNHPNKNSHDDVLEHIKVMSEMIGRPLKKGEIVHHINFIRNCNRKKNLYLFKNQSEHGKSSKSLFKLVDGLLKAKVIKFKNGVYMLTNRRALVVDGGNHE